ncbi:hypothetical protein K0M31_004512 [Melipona bicolor]|uniref:Uncharacterized protein n=1 Tax=Melipona bicolor TaxID=60889 RepID=A0AA40KNK2_9HYME|nr:hypothetical protein K0M31_004512 [Melipona bicolor]
MQRLRRVRAFLGVWVTRTRDQTERRGPLHYPRYPSMDAKRSNDEIRVDDGVVQRPMSMRQLADKRKDVDG